MTSIPIGANLKYILHSIGVHEFIFDDVSHDIVDLWLAKTAQINDTSASGERLRFLLNYRTTEMIPLMYAVSGIQRVIRERAERRPTRVAILHNKFHVFSAITTFLRFLPGGEKDEVRFFSLDERDSALAWLDEARSSAA